ncbi:uncharacterized protein LOC133309986 [Gastrolobium bilobum]|uniref:uncharacterized protein LOC133309986 n=1 Tax=Gastrolobium bilobum TaxID=150636 RepID=UPI002AAFBB44|nr:uncharacterized protein LOC133309986 [Gastrolobium bilobum]
MACPWWDGDKAWKSRAKRKSNEELKAGNHYGKIKDQKLPEKGYDYERVRGSHQGEQKGKNHAEHKAGNYSGKMKDEKQPEKSYERGYVKGYERGYEDGYTNGYEHGYEYGYDNSGAIECGERHHGQDSSSISESGYSVARIGYIGVIEHGGWSDSD